MNERELLAAEHALRLLEGEELLEAYRLAATDEDFAREVAAWEERLAPMFDEIGEADVPPELWERIRARISDDASSAVVTLRRSLNRWKGIAATAAALAASLLLVVAWQVTRPDAPAPAPVAVERAPLLTASVASEDRSLVLFAAFEAGELVVVPARVEAQPGRDHELWIIGADAQPRSLGLIEPGEPRRIAVPAPLIGDFEAQGTLAVSVEPEGGSPTGLPTGPVVATGNLVRV